MAKKSDPFSGAMADWEPVASSATTAFDSSDRPLSKPNRVALEHGVLVEKYLQGTPKSPSTASPFSGADSSGTDNPLSEAGHATLERRKKKGSLDNDVNAKTFVVSGGKIIGSQG